MSTGVRGPLKILVLDDERNIASTLRRILEQQGYEAAECFNSDEAIQKAGILLPDLLLTDIDLAGTNGVETALRIKKIMPQCRILLISGHPWIEESIESLLERPDFSFLAKPFQIPALIQEIAHMLSSAQCDESGDADTVGQACTECTNGSVNERYVAGGQPRTSARFPSRQKSGGGFVSSSTAFPTPIANARRYPTQIRTFGNSERGFTDTMNCSFNAEPRLVEALEKQSTSVFCGSGSTLFTQSGSPTGIFVLHHGCVVLEMRADDGKVLVHIELLPLSILGLSATIAKQAHRFSAIARPGSKLRFIAREQFENVFRSSGALYPPLLQVLAKEVWSVRQAMSELFARPARMASRPVHATTRPFGSAVSPRIWVN
jgi:CheY-like chemotaxis protein/CRP-like cAMP-binding protein